MGFELRSHDWNANAITIRGKMLTSNSCILSLLEIMATISKETRMIVNISKNMNQRYGLWGVDTLDKIKFSDESKMKPDSNV